MVLGCGRGLKRDLYIGHARGGEDKETPPLTKSSQGADKARPPRSPTCPFRDTRIGRRHEVPAF